MSIVVVSFIVYWIIDWTSRLIWPSLLPAHFFKDPKSVRILGRHTMDVAAMIFCVYLGVQAQNDSMFLKFQEMTPEERTYGFHPTCQLLICCQLAYQAKNLIDSYMCQDGWIFYAHHIGTAILCLTGLHPFLHYYSPFFLGTSEISTGILCILGLLDDDHGVKGLGAVYPKTKVMLGVFFAAAFVPIRCIIWPYLSYFFWLDMLVVWKAGAHSAGVITYALAVNVGLTSLQFYWLFEIFGTIKKELFSPMDQADEKCKPE